MHLCFVSACWINVMCGTCTVMCLCVHVLCSCISHLHAIHRFWYAFLTSSWTDPLVTLSFILWEETCWPLSLMQQSNLSALAAMVSATQSQNLLGLIEEGGTRAYRAAPAHIAAISTSKPCTGSGNEHRCYWSTWCNSQMQLVCCIDCCIASNKYSIVSLFNIQYR